MKLSMAMSMAFNAPELPGRYDFTQMGMVPPTDSVEVSIFCPNINIWSVRIP